MSTAFLFNYAVNSVWQVPLLALCTWFALQIARPTARTQHLLWIATLLLAIVLPMRGTPPAAVEANVSFDAASLDANDPALRTPIPPLARLPFVHIAISTRTRDLLVWFYLCFGAICLLRLIASQLAVRRLVRASTLRNLTPFQDALCRSILGRPSTPPILTLPPAYTVPLVAGAVRPAILLPGNFKGCSVDEFTTVLAHELAHIRRRDVLANLLLRIAALPIAYHPATLLLHRRIRHTREMLCDAMAASAMTSPAAYANTLLALADRLIHTEEPCAAIGLFQAMSKPLLEERIMHLIAPATTRRPFRLARIVAGTLLFAAAATTASLLHLTPAVLAAQQPAAPAPHETKRIAASPQRSYLIAQTSELPQPVPPAPPTPAAASAATAQPVAPLLTPGPELTPEQRKRVEERLNAASEQILNSTAKLRGPDFQRLTAKLSAQAIQQQMQKLNAPEFRQQLSDALGNSTARFCRPPAICDAFGTTELSGQPGFSSLSAAQQPDLPIQVSAAVMAGQVLNRTMPVYPPEAKAAKIAGAVVLRATIGKDGTLEALQIVSGPEELRRSAWDSVKTWTWKPYLLNGQPMPVETTITVNYSMESPAPPAPPAWRP